MSPQSARELFAASASPLRRRALSFFRSVSELREGHRADLSVQERRWRREELEGVALWTDYPAILRRCQEALATKRARRLARIGPHHRRPPQPSCPTWSFNLVQCEDNGPVRIETVVPLAVAVRMAEAYATLAP